MTEGKTRQRTYNSRSYPETIVLDVLLDGHYDRPRGPRAVHHLSGLNSILEEPCNMRGGSARAQQKFPGHWRRGSIGWKPSSSERV